MIDCRESSVFDNAQNHVTAFRPISEAARSWSDDKRYCSKWSRHVRGLAVAVTLPRIFLLSVRVTLPTAGWLFDRAACCHCSCCNSCISPPHSVRKCGAKIAGVTIAVRRDYYNRRFEPLIHVTDIVNLFRKLVLLQLNKAATRNRAEKMQQNGLAAGGPSAPQTPHWV